MFHDHSSGSHPRPQAEDLPEIDLEEKPQEKKRRCLICDSTFDSFGPGNRICPTCKSSARWKTGW